MTPKERVVEMDAFRNFRWRYMNKVYFDTWDLSGRTPHLWSHHMDRVNGIIFVIDQKDADTVPDYLPRVIKEVLNLVVNYFTIPLTFIVNQHERHDKVNCLDEKWFEHEVFSVADKKKEKFQVFEMNLKQLDSVVKEEEHTSKQLGLAAAFQAFVEISCTAVEQAK